MIGLYYIILAKYCLIIILWGRLSSRQKNKNDCLTNDTIHNKIII